MIIPELNNFTFSNPRPCGLKVGNIEAERAEYESTAKPESTEYETVEFGKAGIGAAALGIPEFVGTRPERAVSLGIESDGPATSLILFGNPATATAEEVGRMGGKSSVLEEEATAEKGAAAEDEEADFDLVEFESKLERAAVGAKLEMAVSVPVVLVCSTTSFILFGSPAGMVEGGTMDDQPSVFDETSVDEEVAAKDAGTLEDKASVTDAVCDERAEFKGRTDDVAEKLEFDIVEDRLDEYSEDRDTIQLHQQGWLLES